MKFQIPMIAWLLLILPGCTTISRGATDYLRIDTVPQGATVTTTIETPRSQSASKANILHEKQYRGCSPTPCLLKVARRGKFAIKIEHEGYEPAEIAIGGDIPIRSVNLDMNVPIGSVVGNVGLTATSSALASAFVFSLNQALTSVLTLGSAPASASSAVVGGAAVAGAGIGVAMIGVDFLSGSFKNIYPNPIVIKLAPEGEATVTDPNMLMFKLRAAKRRLARKYCVSGSAGKKAQKRNCALAKKMDKERDIENAELLASEPEIIELIATIKQQLNERRAEARAAR